MKVNLKTTNDENSAATPTCHQMGQRTLNGIIGNTRRGIVVDQTLDPDSNNPVANKAVSTALAALVAGTTQTFVSNATALTEGKIAKTSIVGGNSAKCKVGDIVLVADGNIYKISAIDETDITLALPALASYATAASLPQNRVLHGDLKDATGESSYPSGEGGGASIQSIDGYVVSDKDWDAEIATDLTNIKLKVPFVLNLYGDNTLSGEPEVQVVMTNSIGGLYYIGMVSLIGQMLVVMGKNDDTGKYLVGMSDIPTSMKSTLFNKPIMVPDNWDGPTPILPCSMNDNGKVLSVVNGEAQWATPTGGSGGGTALQVSYLFSTFIDLSAGDYAVGDIITSSAKHITTGERIPLWTRNKTITEGGATFVLSVNAGNGGNTIRVYAICVKAGTVDTAVSYTVDVDGLKPIS